MTTLLLADHDKGLLSDQTRKALTAVLKIGADVDIIVAGTETEAAARAAAALAGVRRVVRIEAPHLAEGMAEALAAQVAALAGPYAVIAAAATSTGKSVMPRVAALIDAPQISEIVEVLAPDTFRRPIYAGNALQTVRSKEAKLVLTVRGASFSAAQDGGMATIETAEAVADPGVARFVENRRSETDRPQLTSARVIVSGGRALGSEERFREAILPVADKLGAAVGASRAAVDAGYAPNDWQVGQTGKIVAPELYIAAGISGAIQHLAGMKDSKIIVAINTDGEAPIFEVADYGLEADLFTALPELERLV